MQRGEFETRKQKNGGFHNVVREIGNGFSSHRRILCGSDSDVAQFFGGRFTRAG
jgi:hypothetical protein